MFAHAENNVTNEEENGFYANALVCLTLYLECQRHLTMKNLTNSIEFLESEKKPDDCVHFKGVRINKNKYMGLFNLRVQHTALVNYRVDNLFSLLSNIIGINDDWRLKNIVYFTCAPVAARSLSISKHKTLVLYLWCL